MARKQKIGLDYFPLDTDVFSDIKVRKLLKAQGLPALSIYFSLLCLIYKEGYYINYDEDLPFIISDNLNCKEELVKETILKCLEIGLFNKELYEKENILTSKGIQERFQFVVTNAKRSVSIVNFNLINTEFKPQTSEEMPITTEEMPINSELSTQRKEKKRKEELRGENTPPQSFLSNQKTLDIKDLERIAVYLFPSVSPKVRENEVLDYFKKRFVNGAYRQSKGRKIDDVEHDFKTWITRNLEGKYSNTPITDGSINLTSRGIL